MALSHGSGSPLDPAADFADDGGTRAWRQNQATYGRVIDVSPPQHFGSLRRWYRETPLWKLMLQVLILSVVVPWAIIIIPLVGLVGMHAVFGWP